MTKAGTRDIKKTTLNLIDVSEHSPASVHILKTLADALWARDQYDKPDKKKAS